MRSVITALEKAMSLEPEHKDNVNKANKRRATHICQNCYASGVTVRDGGEVGGLPGIKYRCCDGCGWTQAITKRQRKYKL